MTLRLVLVALLLGTSSALAFDSSKLIQFGTLPLDDLTPVIAKSALLQKEIQQSALGGQQGTSGREMPRNALSGPVEKSRRPSSVTLRL